MPQQKIKIEAYGSKAMRVLDALTPLTGPPITSSTPAYLALPLPKFLGQIFMAEFHGPNESGEPSDYIIRRVPCIAVNIDSEHPEDNWMPIMLPPPPPPEEV